MWVYILRPIFPSIPVLLGASVITLLLIYYLPADPARMLGIASGDRVEAELLEGERQRLSIPVAGLLDDYVGVRRVPDDRRAAIDENIIVSIMLLKDVYDSWKILLLLGNGVFTEHKSIAYTENMKKMANPQKLYLIIADSDYIYGTNYQFCHGYLSKDLTLTQEKIIQSIGRIGRNYIQQNYSVRMRDNNPIKTLFTEQGITPVIINMNRLFVRD